MRKKALFYTLCIMCAILSTLIVIIDSIASVYVDDIWVYGNISFIAGTIISFIISLFFCLPLNGRPIGKYIDPNFYMIKLPDKKQLSLYVLMSIGNAISTVGYFYIISATMDPSAILPFMQLVVIYLVLGEIIIEGDIPSLVEIQSLTVIMFGALLASISPEGTLDLKMLGIVMTLINGGGTLRIIAQRKMRLMRIDGKRIDSINIRLWNLLFSTIFFIMIIAVFDPESIVGVFHVSTELLVITIVSMLITFFARITYIRALGIGRASITQAVTSSSVILAIPFTIIAEKLVPGTLVELYASPLVLLIKIIGTIMVALGIATLALSEVRAYILIKASRGPWQEILCRISKIRGITRVSALAGKFDFIAKVKIRTLGKAYRLIVRELEKIRGIEDFLWLSTLYEWEEV